MKSNCMKCKHCVYVARDYCGSGNKWITCDSKFEPMQDDNKNCKNFVLRTKNNND